MIKINNIKSLNSYKKPISLALGNFDGVHQGHAAVIQNTISMIIALVLASMIMNFKKYVYK